MECEKCVVPNYHMSVTTNRANMSDIKSRSVTFSSLGSRCGKVATNGRPSVEKAIYSGFSIRRRL